MTTPLHRSGFNAEAFLAYVREQGGEVLTPTNEWELARYRAAWRGTDQIAVHIVYTKANGRLTFTGGSEGHYRAFQAGTQMKDLPSVKKPKPKAKASFPDKAKLRARLIERDGEVCWFCGCFMPPDDQTIEHLVAKSNGGLNGLDNYALAHAECNRNAGNLPLVEKIALRQALRDERADLPPWEIAA